MEEAQYNQKFVEELYSQVNQSDSQIDSFLDARKELINRYVGDYYGEHYKEGIGKKNPLNMVQMTANIYIPLLVMNNPQYRVRTNSKAYKSTAWIVQEDLNETAKDIDLRESLEKVAYDSLFFMGLMKTGYGHGPEVPLSEIVGDIPVEGEQAEQVRQLLDQQVEIPQLFVKSVSPEDYIVDPHAKEMSEIQFEGDKYTVPLAVAKSWFPDKDLQADPETTDEKVTANRRGRQPGRSRLFDTIKLVDIWIPMDQTVVTFAYHQTDKGVLSVSEWDGPETGPYHKLGYYTAPDHIFPAPPATSWIALHDMLNDLTRSIRRRVQNQKSIGIYGKDNSEDAQNLQDAKDGDMVGLNAPERVNVVDFGTQTTPQQNVLSHFMQVFSQQAGNTDLLGGMQADARTATEASMLGQNAGLRIQYLQSKVENFAQKVGKTIAELRWHDPFAERELIKPIDYQGAHIELPARYHPETKVGSIDDYNLEVVPYSLRGRNPQQYRKTLMEWWNHVVLPTAEAAMQQGAQPDFVAFAKFMAEEMGVHQHDWFYRKGQASQSAQQAPGERAGGVSQPEGPAGMQRRVEQMQQQAGGQLPDEVRQRMTHKE